jgi:peroxiredoxin
MRLILISAVIAGMTLMACNNTGKMGSTEPVTRMDSISYALGRDLGNNLQQQDIEVNPEALLDGMKATMTEGGESALSDQDAQMMLMVLQQEIRQKQMQQMQQNPQSQPGADSKIQMGQPAPEISLPTPEGEELSLSDLRGKVVLIDFWASWCKPCRAENPVVVQAYNQYKDQGFEILGVSLDRSKEAWLQAIEKDGLTWPHVSDLQFWNSAAAKEYGVSAIPYTVLVDREGNVIAERLRGGSLNAKLAEIFGE